MGNVQVREVTDEEVIVAEIFVSPDILSRTEPVVTLKPDPEIITPVTLAPL
jgi:hypothetical protein